MLDIELDDIERRAKLASDDIGSEDTCGYVREQTDYCDNCGDSCVGHDTSFCAPFDDKDMVFIQNARADVLALVEEVRRLREARS
jgi:hypothetical protein